MAVALTIASLAQGALMVATATGDLKDVRDSTLTPAPEVSAQSESAQNLSSTEPATVSRAKLDTRLERQKRRAMERNVRAALDRILERRQEAQQDEQEVLAALEELAATPEPTPEPTVEPTAEPTPEPTAEPAEIARVAEPTAEATAEPTAEPTADVTPTPEVTPTEEPINEITNDENTDDEDTGDEPVDYAFYLSEEFLRPYFGDNWEKASQVVNCESSGNPEAVYADSEGNPLYVGLFQIYVGNWNGQYSADMLKDPYLNAQLAAELSGGGANFSGNWPSCGAGL